MDFFEQKIFSKELIMHNFYDVIFYEKHHMDYVVESVKIVAAFSSCEGSATPFVI